MVSNVTGPIKPNGWSISSGLTSLKTNGQLIDRLIDIDFQTQFRKKIL